MFKSSEYEALTGRPFKTAGLHNLVNRIHHELIRINCFDHSFRTKERVAPYLVGSSEQRIQIPAEKLSNAYFQLVEVCSAVYIVAHHRENPQSGFKKRFFLHQVKYIGDTGRELISSIAVLSILESNYSTLYT